jgi:glycosyltransferase involved in cell wall biosynthesis
LACEPEKTAPTKPADTILIVAVGRLAIEKGHRHLLAALPKAVAANPRVRCWLIGYGPL